MTDYEITYISDPQLDEAGRGELDASIDGKITELKGSINYTSPNLRKRLAYGIDKKNTAFIRTVQTELDPALIKDVHQFLKKAAGIIRFSIVQTARREEISQEIVERYTQRKDANKVPAKKVTPTEAAPKKEVTMQDVEKGIEDALSAEVK